MHGSRQWRIAGKKVVVDIHETPFDVRVFGAVDHQIRVSVSGMQVFRSLRAVVFGGSIRGCQRHHRVNIVVETPFADLAGGGHHTLTASAVPEETDGILHVITPSPMVSHDS